MIVSPKTFTSKGLEGDDVIEWHLVIRIRGSEPLLGGIYYLHQFSMYHVQVGDCCHTPTDGGLYIGPVMIVHNTWHYLSYDSQLVQFHSINKKSHT